MRRRETIPVLCSCVLPIAATATCCLTAGEDSHPLYGYSGVESNWRLQANRATADSTTDDTKQGLPVDAEKVSSTPASPP
ncbi:hypothetical protein PF008_g10492 [Phytophthora fragariae]|uniref:RxLR effector protein n=1 Tax=Phytophthora fragariae TaxID=53985 RepID=A0A6G0RTK1_9STRA|nr:hypothetical protein PF008_g10492 [Phytophthora fragariae]